MTYDNFIRRCPICLGRSPLLISPATSPPPKQQNQIQITEKYFGLHGDMVKCKECGFTYVGNKNFVFKVTKLYRKMSDEAYIREEKERKIGFIRILNTLNKCVKNKGKILDVGCSSGMLLSEAAKDGWKAYGIDPSIWAYKMAKQLHNLTIHNKTFESFNNQKRKFDAVTMLDVIEHVKNPRQIFQKVKLLLKEDGIFCLVTPNYGSLTAKILGKRWWGIRLAHLSYFRFEDLKKLIEEAGLEIIKEKPYIRYFSLYYILVRLFPTVERSHFLSEIFKKITVPLIFFDTFELYLRRTK